MKFLKTELADVYTIELEKFTDDRGFFARGWCAKEFEDQGLASFTAQVNVSYNELKGTLRGMHYQVAPFEEVKLVRCISGALYDVIIDIRKNSPTYGKHAGFELSAENRKMLYVPTGFAHGFQTLEDNTEALYQVSEFYTPSAELGIRYNDPMFKIKWPCPVSKISEKDAGWPDYNM
ncbi:MAG: dTDP-4-dehydrorhamnose 3,5-epimerase [Pseudomonadales bacterium]|nr:dTDP-4-dehydrorhamnose 3,5-epimerase [Pseudomonadales bacterium]